MLEFAELIGTTSGLIGASKSCVLAKLSPDLIITNSSGQASIIKREIELISGKKVFLLPALDIFPGEEIAPSKELIGERCAILSRWEGIVVAPLKAILQKTSNEIKSITIQQGGKIDRDNLIEQLVGLGYKRMGIVGERGEFSVRGGIIDVFAANMEMPVRFELWGDKVDSMRSFDSQNQKSQQKINEAVVFPAIELFEKSVLDFLPKNPKVAIDEPAILKQTYEKLFDEAKEFNGEKDFISFEEIIKTNPTTVSSFEKSIIEPAPKFFGKIEELKSELEKRKKVYIVSKHAEALKESISHPIILGELSGGFVINDTAVITDYELFGEKMNPPKAVSREGVDESLLADIKIGDYVVHENYGIGIYCGMEKVEGVEGEHLLIEYAESDKLYVPLTMIGMVEKYSVKEGFKPKLARLGGQEWARTKNRVKKSVKDMAEELLSLYADRSQAERAPYPQVDVWQKELEASFPYEETKDQQKAIIEVQNDMSLPKPMDRLICGDVGYGKTEVAIRAAAKAAAFGKQAAILAPTTILAEQHYNNIKERFNSLPFSVDMLSRFRSKAEQKNTIAKLAEGTVDVIVGTHRLLSKDIKFKNLGLIIIDEEQRFGVAHKEKLKRLKVSVDSLTLTATPIPRTLYFSLSGVRDMSLINTAPLDRSPVKTYVLAWSESVLREAVLKELDRGGQIYFVYNKVETISGMAAKLKKIVPEARVGIAHGQMGEKMLEQTMGKFLQREFDILLCSTIIESGLDITNVNTIIIDEADRFGLSQLYQLRGRVGRSSVKAYAYLFYYPEKILSTSAIERLKAIQEYASLGSGYKLAMRDLEIRGAGNILGAEQHGHMLSVGFDMYCELLEEAAREIKGIKEPTPRQVEIDIKVDAYIPADYMEDERQRIATYRRINLIEKENELRDLFNELEDRFGKMQNPLKSLFEIIELKLFAKERGVKLIKENNGLIKVEYFNGSGKEFKKCPIPEIKSRVEK